jgi:hypothetical protein
MMDDFICLVKLIWKKDNMEDGTQANLAIQAIHSEAESNETRSDIFPRNFTGFFFVFEGILEDLRR